MNKKASKTKKCIKRRLNVKRAFIFALSIAAIAFVAIQLFKVNVENIEVDGNDFVSDSKIIKMASLKDNTSYLAVTSSQICKRIKKDPIINTCKIKKEFWFKLKIIVTENKPLFLYVSTDKLILSDKSQIEKTTAYNVPTLINYVPEKILDKFIDGLKDIDSDIIHSISEIEYTPSENADGTYIDEERFMLEMNDGNIVYINNRNLSVLNNYKKIYASIGEKKGYYNFDADYGNYYFVEFTTGE